MRSPVLLPAVLLAACASSSPATTAPASAIRDAETALFYEGDIRFREDAWPVRIAVDTLAGPAVTVDVPEMVMAWQPAPAHLDGDTIEIEMPFGLGAFSFAITDLSPSATRVVGGDTMRLSLDRGGPPPYSREPFSFRSGEATLVGTLVRPSGAGPHPAIVLVHGSAPQGRASWGYRSWADPLARAGFLVLFYDKRGTGESTGEWMDRSYADLDELTADLRAAVDTLRRTAGVDGSRIGLLGGSQAAWVSLGAALESTIAFMVLRGAPAVTPAQQEAQSVAARLRADGVAPAAVDSALAHTRLYFEVVAGTADIGALLASSRRARDAAWGEYVLLAESDDDLFWWRRNHALDPAPLLERLDVPALFLYGADDVVVPPADNVPVLLRHARGRNVTVLVVPDANHTLEVPGGRDAAGRWRFPRRSPAAIESTMGWLRRSVLDQQITRSPRSTSPAQE